MTDSTLQLRKYIDPDFSTDVLTGFAQWAWGLSEQIYAAGEDRVPRPGDDMVDPTRAAILGTLLIEPMLMALVRTALAARSVRISADMPLPPARE